MVKAIVEYDYIAQKPDELTIHKGDIINNINKKPDGWWEGTLRDKRGMFPDNFVQVIHKDLVMLRSKSTKVHQCRVVFSYHPAHDDELSLAVGDIIDVLGEVEEGWWKGRLGNAEGVFPCNFVAEIDGEKSHSKMSSKEDLTNLAGENDSSTPNLPPKSSMLSKICQALYPYDACNEDELTLREGDLITLISKTGQDHGWWRGELRGQVGLFPDNFVVILSKYTEDGQAKQEEGGDKPSLNKLLLSPQVVDEVPKSNVASHRKLLEMKLKDRALPPVPDKNPSVPKKSPMAVAITGTGTLAELKQKLADRVDSTAGSHMSRSEHNKLEFDQVERSAILSDMRANRAKKPTGRRPPSVIYRDSEQPSLTNGSADQSFACMSEVSNDEDEVASKPKVHEWEKHKVPWVKELKLNQAKRMTPASAYDAPKPGRDAVSPTDMSRLLSALGSKLRTSPNDAAGMLFQARSLADQLSAAAMPPQPQSIHSVEPPDIEPVCLVPAATVTASLKLSPVSKSPIAEKNIDPKSVLHSSLERKGDTVPLKHYLELAERVACLEAHMQQQFQDMQITIGELRSKLQLETELRMVLQLEMEKVAQCMTQV